jgi:hypothetical protein
MTNLPVLSIAVNPVVTWNLNTIFYMVVKAQLSLYWPGQAHRGPGDEVPRISKQSAHEDGNVVSPRHRPRLPHREDPWYLFLLVKLNGKSQ